MTRAKKTVIAAALVTAMPGCGDDADTRRGSASAGAALTIAPISSHGAAILEIPDLSPTDDKLIVVDYQRGRSTFVAVALEN